MSARKKELTERKRRFYLTFFNQQVDHFEAKEVNGFILLKHWDGNRKLWAVDLYTPESYKAMRTEQSSLFNEFSRE